LETFVLGGGNIAQVEANVVKAESGRFPGENNSVA
jgi:hypothetical protein